MVARPRPGRGRLETVDRQPFANRLRGARAAGGGGRGGRLIESTDRRPAGTPIVLLRAECERVQGRWPDAHLGRHAVVRAGTDLPPAFREERAYPPDTCARIRARIGRGQGARGVV